MEPAMLDRFEARGSILFDKFRGYDMARCQYETDARWLADLGNLEEKLEHEFQQKRSKDKE